MDQQMSRRNNTPCVDVETINTPNIPIIQFSEKIDTFLLKSTMGSGKTNMVYDFLKYNININYFSVLIVTFRRTLCEKYLEDLPGFEIYEKINKYQINKNDNPFVIIQVDSLKRIRSDYDLIIFDEYTYTMDQLMCSAKSKKMCFDVMTQLCQENNHMIFMDAMLEDYWVDYISSFNRNIKYVKNTYSIHKDKKIVNYGNNEINMIKKIKTSLDNGENIVIASNSKNKIRIINNILKNDVKYNKIKTLTINKESKEKYNLNEWKKARVLMYSPSIVAGVSFTEKHYNRFFGFFCNSSAIAEMSVQQMFRVRDISTNEYNLCFNISGKKDYPETDEGIKELIFKNDNNLVTGLVNININYIKTKIIEDEYFKLFLIIQKLRFSSCNNYETKLLSLLKNQGINRFEKIGNEVNKEEKKEYNRIKRETKKYYEEQESIRICNAIDKTQDEIDTIRDKFSKTDNEIYEIKKYDILNKYKIKSNQLNPENVMKYSKAGKQLWNLSYIEAYGDDYINAINKRLNYEEKKIDSEDISYRLNRDRKYEKIALCEDFIRFLGFKNTLDKSYIDIDKNKFKEYLRDNHERFELLFKCNKLNINIFNDEKSYMKTKMYLNSRIYSIFKIRIVEDRKKNKFYIKGLDFWNDIITYKNPIIISEIKEKENNMYESAEYNDLLNQFLIDNGLIKNKNDPVETDPNYVNPNDYINLYKNKSKNVCDLCEHNEPSRWLLEDGINHCEICHWNQ